MKHTILLALSLLLTSAVSAQVAMPEEVRNYAKNIKDNGESLGQEYFSTMPAFVKGRVYEKDANELSEAEVTVRICNPFTGYDNNYKAKINRDGTFAIEVPMCVLHQTVEFWPSLGGGFCTIVLTAGKTVVVDYDKDLNRYFSGENVDLNYALDFNIQRKFKDSCFYSNESMAKIVNLTMPQYKEYAINCFNDYCKRIDTMHITKRAKELLTLVLKSEAALELSMGKYNIEDSYCRINGLNDGNQMPDENQMPDSKRPVMDFDYLDYPQRLGIDDFMMFYSTRLGYNIYGWRLCYERIEESQLVPEAIDNLIATQSLSDEDKEMALAMSRRYKAQGRPSTRAEKDFFKNHRKYFDDYLESVTQKLDEDFDAFATKMFGKESYFVDFFKLQNYCQCFETKTMVPDSVIAEVEKMRWPFYSEYIRVRNYSIASKIALEQRRGDYYTHKAGDGMGDSLLVDILKDYKGKVVLIDFWNTWCMPCRAAIQQMEPMKKAFEGKDVEIVYIADESSPKNAYDNMIVTMKGHHYRFTEAQANSLRSKFDFSGIPSYIIVGKDGIVKDFHTGFRGLDYYNAKIEEELKK